MNLFSTSEQLALFYRWFVLVMTTIVLLVFAGCGSGGDSINRILDPQNPAVVKNVSAYPANRRVRIVWAKSEDPSIVGYNIYRSTDVNAGFTRIGSVGQVTAPSFQDEGADVNGDGLPDGLSNNVTHFYKVTAFDRSGRETPVDLSPSISATPGQLPSQTADLAVSNVRAYAGKSQAFIAWDRIEDERIHGYAVYRSISGVSGGKILVAITDKLVHSWHEGGLSNAESYVYSVSPVLNEIDNDASSADRSGLLEGRPTEARAVNPGIGDATIPKPPGSSPNAPYSVKALQETQSGKSGVLLQFTRPVANTDGSILADHDDLIKGAYLVYRSLNAFNQFQLIGILENAGSAVQLEFFDPYGTASHFYYVKVGDESGNISEKSDIASINVQGSPPPTVKYIEAKSGAQFGQVEISWQPVTGRRITGYNLYRSLVRDNAYIQVGSGIQDNDSDPSNLIRFQDSSQALNLGQTYFYKASAIADGMESSLSSPAAGTPGPSSGIFIVEGENAVKRIQGTGPNAQFFPDHFTRNGKITASREGLSGSFSGDGVITVEPQFPATSNIVAGERIDLVWRVDIRSRVGDSAGGAIQADVYMVTADEANSGRWRIFLDDKFIPDSIAPGTEPNSAFDTGFDGIIAEYDFKNTKAQSPIQPTR
ncbi:MAG: hypothetical protein H3C47_15725, partial [Candidatus Cloacimonetes bacterium]|nr:hypothetical protein [Candidatus Cloacimonadota bacterium]